MPIYEFRCESCGQVFELLALSQKDQMEAKCPHCDGEDLSRVMSACNSTVSGSSSGGGAALPGVENRSCAGAGSCSTITLPGHER